MYRRPATLLALAAITGLAACRASAPATSGSPSAGGDRGSGVAAAPARPAAATPAAVALGDSLFNNGSCQRCHGKGGVGAANGPALDGKRWLHLPTGSFDEIVGIITTGVPQTAIKDSTRRNAMRPRGGQMNLDDAQIRAVAAYVWTISHPPR